jgi:rubrerythrin
LKTAIETELTGFQFYKNAAKSTNDPLGKETFSRMAEEEFGHFNYLRRQYQSVLENGEYDFSKELDKKQHKHAASPIFSDDIKRRIKDARAFYRELAAWEEDHYKAFQGQLDVLKEDYFQANHFVPM